MKSFNTCLVSDFHQFSPFSFAVSSHTSRVPFTALFSFFFSIATFVEVLRSFARNWHSYCSITSINQLLNPFCKMGRMSLVPTYYIVPSSSFIYALKRRYTSFESVFLAALQAYLFVPPEIVIKKLFQTSLLKLRKVWAALFFIRKCQVFWKFYGGIWKSGGLLSCQLGKNGRSVSTFRFWTISKYSW